MFVTFCCFDVFRSRGGQNELDGQDPPPLPPRRGALFEVPSGIRPVLQRTGIEVLCWGVRNMRKFQLMSVNSPSVEIEIGGNRVESSVIKNAKRNPNFNSPLLFLDVMMPKEELYTPPMNVGVRDNRQFGRKPIVGQFQITGLEAFRRLALNAQFNPLDNFPSK
ncbi:unnamed protein product [Protopolystoma xenopodis]|uniref:C2 domain-containing protein n=1 Tax=Protopolystoma xenopodis TaxID=117903 RepID=A0A448WLS7_9PLAT|nr:unnamed protein product [Protopolystoma xenopodis]